MATPPAYAVGELGPLKLMETCLWAAFGPWAPRRLAAIDYSMRYINNYPLPTGWDWAAKALDFSAPEPVIRGIPVGEPLVIRAIAHTHAANANRPMLPPPADTQNAADPLITQITSQAVIPPQQKPSDRKKTEGFIPTPTGNDPTSQLKLPLESLTQ